MFLFQQMNLFRRFLRLKALIGDCSNSMQFFSLIILWQHVRSFWGPSQRVFEGFCSVFRVPVACFRTVASKVPAWVCTLVFVSAISSQRFHAEAFQIVVSRISMKTLGRGLNIPKRQQNSGGTFHIRFWKFPENVCRRGSRSLRSQPSMHSLLIKGGRGGEMPEEYNHRSI